MYQKMTYKQALIRSLIVGVLISVCYIILSFTLKGKLESLWIALNGIGMFLSIVCHIIPKYEGVLTTVSLCSLPIIICPLFGSIIFLLLRNKKWLTSWMFMSILAGSYLVVNIVMAIIMFIHVFNIMSRNYPKD